MPELLEHSFFPIFFIAYPSQDLQLDASERNPLTPRRVWIVGVFWVRKPLKEREG